MPQNQARQQHNEIGGNLGAGAVSGSGSVSANEITGRDRNQNISGQNVTIIENISQILASLDSRMARNEVKVSKIAEELPLLRYKLDEVIDDHSDRLSCVEDGVKTNGDKISSVRRWQWAQWIVIIVMCLLFAFMVATWLQVGVI